MANSKNLNFRSARVGAKGRSVGTEIRMLFPEREVYTNMEYLHPTIMGFHRWSAP